MSNLSLSTVRVSIPLECMKDVYNMKIIGYDILFYVNKDKLNNFNSSIKKAGLNIVSKIYKLHVSAPSKAVFESIFKKYLNSIQYDDRSNPNRFIATLKIDNEDEYNKYLDLDCDICLVKPFKTTYNNWMTNRINNI